MNKNYIEELMVRDTNEYVITFQEIIEKIEREFIQKGIMLEDESKHKNYLPIEN